MARDLAERLGIRGGFASVDHVVVALWSSEVLHSLRIREASFRSVCPDAPDRFEAWWSGATVDGVTGRLSTQTTSSTLVVLDPLPGQRSSRRRWFGLEQLRTVDPRYRGYAAALDALRSAGLA